ncbi:DMT family transporter [Roseococcus pinisoli]|uniref:DMT family transporter n=1 Tax=Roseococcus pinisoli TaxID=2835040 RepID=A0ABS5QGM6_9PROT|nr:DMT family transporter [Roseococcus pinisoli]MBS7812796.1 DMT family transporter [Roseococcus pinisoli]
MPDPSPQARRLGLLLLVVTTTGWALNWPGMKILLREWPPLASRGVAGVAAALILAALAWRAGETLLVPREAWPRLLFASFTNVVAWMGFGTLCMVWLRVSEGALLIYSMTLWATLLAWPILGIRPAARQIWALVLGFSGIAVLLGGQGFALGPERLPGVAFALAAAVLFALGTVLNRKPLPISPLASAAWQVGLGCLPMLVLGFLFEAPRWGALSANGWAVLAYMTLVPMGLCYVTWFETLRRLPPAVASMGTLLVPLIGVISASLVLGEPLGWREGVAMVLVLGGVTLALRKA